MFNLTKFNVAIVAFVCLGGYTYGYAFAVFGTSIGQPGFYLYFNLDPASSRTATILGAVNALFAGGAAIGGILQGWLGDYLGRVKALGFAAGLALIGSALLAGAINIPMLIIARFIQGVGLGQMLALSTLYVAEVAPPHRRGVLTALSPCSYGCGYLTSAWIGYGCYFSESLTLQWRLPIALCVLSPTILLAGIRWLPESPRFLVMVGRNEEAWDIIKKLHFQSDTNGDATAQAEYLQITLQLQHEKGQESGYIDMFRKPSWRKRSILALLLIFASQSAGDLGISAYVVLIAQQLGLTGSMPLLIYCIYITIALIANFIGAAILDKVGRRKLLLIGFPATAICLLAEALLQRTYIGTPNKSGNAAALFFVFLYIVIYCLCIDNTEFVWCAEIFPTIIRAKGLGLTIFSYFVGALTYTTPAPLAFKNIGWRYYMVWFACNIVSTIFVYFFIFETKNLALEEIGDLFGDEVIVHLTADRTKVVETEHAEDVIIPSTHKGEEKVVVTLQSAAMN